MHHCKELMRILNTVKVGRARCAPVSIERLQWVVWKVLNPGVGGGGVMDPEGRVG